MKRIAFLVLAALLVLPATSGCANQEKEEKSELDNPDLYLLYWQKDISGDTDMQKVIEIFEEKYGGKVTVEGVSSYEQYITQVTAKFSAGASPDWIGGYEYELQPLMEKNILEDITPYIDTDNEDYGWDAMERIKYKGAYYGITGKTGANILFYNKRIFENAGETTPTELFYQGKWDWKTFAELGKRLTVDTNNDGIIDQWGFETYSYDTIFRSNDGMYTRMNENGTIEVSIKDQKTTNAMKFFQDIYVGPNRFGKYDATAWDKDFMNGNTAMLLGFSWMAEMIFYNKMEDEFGIAPFPHGPDVEANSAGGSQYWYQAAVSGCKNPKGFVAFANERMAYGKEKSEKDRHPVWTTEHVEVFEKMKELKVYGGYPSAILINSTFVWLPLAVEGKPVSQLQEHLTPYLNSLIKTKETASES